MKGCWKTDIARESERRRVRARCKIRKDCKKGEAVWGGYRVEGCGGLKGVAEDCKNDTRITMKRISDVL